MNDFLTGLLGLFVLGPILILVGFVIFFVLCIILSSLNVILPAIVVGLLIGFLNSVFKRK